ncbi:APC family permease [Cryobacterium tagatosivorans]|uniref:APC family permease n=1 Tax=Cryobacterium tagatosivorans TaxID=1259199 RepID=A0A4R8UE52_9MICO|nr:APC family permease [Cryobacterium tagatosivorans]TFB51494.1 APC family permease [Cryobacterium tagatosivorans]
MTTLERHLGLGRAIIVGLAAMIGAGVFYVWAPAAAAAGTGLLIGLVIAGVIASLNALSSAQLAMAYPVSGGAYAFGRATLGPWWGFAAGWLFLAGKTASAGAIALIAGGYLWPEQSRAVAVAAVVVLGAVNMAGIRTTAGVSAAIVFTVLGGLLVVFAVIGLGGSLAEARLDLGTITDAGWYGILQSAGLLFFCFAGYARMATLGEEVRDPRHTLPRAIITALGITLVIYAVIGVLCVTILGPAVLATSTSPLADVLGGDEPWTGLARMVAAVACLGSLVGILAGLSRTGLAMARERDLPGPLSRISTRTHAPVVAEATVGIAAIAGILLLDPARLVGFSACAVLVYYAIAHLSALRQGPADRWLPRVIQYAGVAGCLLLAVTLPWQGVLAAAAWLAVGLAGRGIRLALAARPR